MNTLCSGQATAQGDVLQLYRQILHPVFPSAELHHIRGVEIDREDLHVVLTDGIIGLMQAVDGHVTGAFFEGAGQILLIPPNRAERTSLALFTGSGVLETQFQTAYLRFFDDKLAQTLKSGLRGALDTEENPQQYTEKWQRAAEALIPMDSLRLLQAMTSGPESDPELLHLRVGGTTVGVFDVYFDSSELEQIAVAQPAKANNTDFYNVWSSFPTRSAREKTKPVSAQSASAHISDFRIHARLLPPTDLEGEAELTVQPGRSRQKMLILQLSRYLKVSAAQMNGQPAQFIQNEAVSGSDLARRGDDLVAVILPAPLEKDHPAKLMLKYSGPVMFNAGGDVLHVGSRGTWYPSPGQSFANFDLIFDYPAGWTLAATGRRVSSTAQSGSQTAHFISEKPIPLAGFNLGRFQTTKGSSGKVDIEVYAATTVEDSLKESAERAQVHPDPDPARQSPVVAEQAAADVDLLSKELGPFPYSNLEISQLPALLSQAWPGLIYLSSMAFLTDSERVAIIHSPFTELLTRELMLAHEIGHQWWGDAVESESYRDEWMIEAMANYSAAVMLEREDPSKLKIVLDHYRRELLQPVSNGVLADAGPVTLGPRLTSSKFPNAYDIVLYGRGTWLVHMLRSMLRLASGRNDDELFFAALKDVLSKSSGGKISTRDLQLAFEQRLPSALFYDGEKSLDWFFDSWVNGAAIPQFSLQDVHVNQTGGKWKAKGAIRQEYAAKDMVTAIPLYATSQNGHSQFLAFVFVDEDKTEFDLPVPAGTKEILLDPDNTVLRR